MTAHQGADGPNNGLEDGYRGHTLLAAGGGPQAEPGATSRPQPFPVRKAARAVLNVYHGANLSDALAATGIPRQTWYVWLKVGTEGQRYDDAPVSQEALAFAARCRHAIERAQGLCAVRSQRLLLRAAKTSVGTLDWRAAHEHLKHAEATRNRWKEARELKLEHVGTVDHNLRLLERMPDDQLLEAVPAEWRELCEPVSRPALPSPADSR